MTMQTTEIPTPRSLDAYGHWLSEDQRFYECAVLLLQELEHVATEICGKWPMPAGVSIRNRDEYPELSILVQRRDMLSDSIRIFSAMTIEAFLNFYGVVRLGDQWYNDHLVRLPATQKLKKILSICDGITITDTNKLVSLQEAIASRRNELVHPKSKQLTSLTDIENRIGGKIPELAQDAVRDMEDFFVEFALQIPNAKHLIPQRRESP
jgi:hypothetical protein